MSTERMKQFRKAFREVFSVSLNAEQANYIANFVTGNFNIYRETGFGERIPIPRHTVSEAIMRFFRTEQELIDFFTVMLQNEGLRKGGTTVEIKGKDALIKALRKLHWIYDNELGIFYLDNFIFSSINIFDKLKLIDLRQSQSAEQALYDIENNIDSFKSQELEWQVTIRMYNADRQSDALIKKILQLLLHRLDLDKHATNLYISLRELTTNASKANFKFLFNKHIYSKQQITREENYIDFLGQFKEEIAENGMINLLQLAKNDDLFFDLKFKCNKQAIDIWVHNYIPISKIEKQNLLAKLKISFYGENTVNIDDDLAEGAGLGLSMVLKSLQKIVPNKPLLRPVFYPNVTKIGFEILRSDIA